MTDELTLREKVLEEALFFQAASDLPGSSVNDLIAAIATILEDTGSPAHMRVAAELRRE